MYSHTQLTAYFEKHQGKMTTACCSMFRSAMQRAAGLVSPFLTQGYLSIAEVPHDMFTTRARSLGAMAELGDETLSAGLWKDGNVQCFVLNLHMTPLWRDAAPKGAAPASLIGLAARVARLGGLGPPSFCPLRSSEKWCFGVCFSIGKTSNVCHGS